MRLSRRVRAGKEPCTLLRTVLIAEGGMFTSTAFVSDILTGGSVSTADHNSPLPKPDGYGQSTLVEGSDGCKRKCDNAKIH